MTTAHLHTGIHSECTVTVKSRFFLATIKPLTGSLQQDMLHQKIVDLLRVQTTANTQNKAMCFLQCSHYCFLMQGKALHGDLTPSHASLLPCLRHQQMVWVCLGGFLLGIQKNSPRRLQKVEKDSIMCHSITTA